MPSAPTLHHALAEGTNCVNEAGHGAGAAKRIAREEERWFPPRRERTESRGTKNRKERPVAR